MDISFSSRHLEKQLNQERGMVKAFGPQRAKRFKDRVDSTTCSALPGRICAALQPAASLS